MSTIKTNQLAHTANGASVFTLPQTDGSNGQALKTNGSGSKETSASSMYFLDVTDTSLVKCYFYVSSISGSSNVTGTSIPITNFNFIRLGDT